MSETQPEHLSTLRVPLGLTFLLGRDIHSGSAIICARCPAYLQGGFLRTTATLKEQTEVPEAGVKAKHMAGSNQDTLPWNKFVKISDFQLSKRGQGNGFTSGTQLELPVDVYWH